MVRWIVAPRSPSPSSRERSSRAAARTPAKHHPHALHHRSRRSSTGSSGRRRRDLGSSSTCAGSPSPRAAGRRSSRSRTRRRRRGSSPRIQSPWGNPSASCSSRRASSTRSSSAVQTATSRDCDPPAPSSPRSPRSWLGTTRGAARSAPTARLRPGGTSGWCSARSSPRTSRLRACRRSSSGSPITPTGCAADGYGRLPRRPAGARLQRPRRGRER